ncbi:MAG: IPTL-CTERM sorting domain-containing protein, partial [Thermoanaerobaculia bacterium]
QANDINECGADVSYPAPGGTCTSVTCNPASGAFFPVGTTPVTCSDPLAVAGCGFNVTVNDIQPPVLVCPADISQTLPPGDPSGPVFYPDPTYSDNCPGGGPATCVPPSGSEFPGGATTPVSCTALDASQNTATCSFNISLGVTSIVEVPTVSRWGLIALSLLIAGAAFLVLRRQS